MHKNPNPAVPGYDGPRKTALESLRLFCIGCMCGSFSQVSDCPSVDCAFYLYRMGIIEDGASRRLLKVIKTYCDGCAPGGDVAGCAAGKNYLDLVPCPVWPYRRGVSPYYSAEAREQRRARTIPLFGTAAQEADYAPRMETEPGRVKHPRLSRRLVRGFVRECGFAEHYATLPRVERHGDCTPREFPDKYARARARGLVATPWGLYRLATT